MVDMSAVTKELQVSDLGALLSMIKSAANPFAQTIGSIVLRILRKPSAARTVVEKNILSNAYKHRQLGGSYGATELAHGIFSKHPSVMQRSLAQNTRRAAPGVYMPTTAKPVTGGMRQAAQTQAEYAKRRVQQMRSGLGKYDPTTGQRVPVV